jgi:hypothetical protein
MSLDLPVEILKCWSQNLGHQGLLTTLTSYGTVPIDRQGELIRRGLPKAGEGNALNADVLAEVIRRIQHPGRR